MSHAITWTPVADRSLLEMRAAGLTWPVVARRLHVGRNAAIERARRLGLPPSTRLPQARAIARDPRSDRAPLPAGHPHSWGAITDHTPLHGSPYPHPVFL